MVIIAIIAGVGSFVQKYSFGTLGNNVTLKVRTILYSNILQKNLGWFDHRDNGPSVLTSTMASDTSLINGISTESLGP
jgi:ATP-binding cassette, subfamily B (MDR/TAP), member 1